MLIDDERLFARLTLCKLVASISLTIMPDSCYVFFVKQSQQAVNSIKSLFSLLSGMKRANEFDQDLELEPRMIEGLNFIPQ